MQKALRNLTEGTVEQLIIIDRLPYPDKSCTYELVLYLHMKMPMPF